MAAEKIAAALANTRWYENTVLEWLRCWLVWLP